jgi:hypothetical protein
MATSEVKNLTGGAVRDSHVKLFIAFEPYFLNGNLNLGGLPADPKAPARAGVIGKDRLASDLYGANLAARVLVAINRNSPVFRLKSDRQLPLRGPDQHIASALPPST